MLADNCTGWAGAFPCPTERSNEVVKALLKESIPRSGLPRTFQSDSGLAFTVAITQVGFQISWALHSS